MKAPLSTAQLSHLIGLIYDAAIDPTGWSRTVEEIRTALDFETGALELRELPSSKVLVNVTANIAPDYARRMPDYTQDVIEQWGGWDTILALPVDQPAVLSHINPAALDLETTDNRYSLEWGKPQGLNDVMALVLAKDSNAVGNLAFGRHISAGAIGAWEIEGARLLLPHLQRAATINRLLDVATLARSTFEATLDMVAVPILLVSASLHLVHANPSAWKLLAAGDLLQLHNDRLAALNGASHALAVAVAVAAQDESSIGRKGLGIPARRVDGSVAALHVLPLRPSRAPMDHRAIAAVFVAETITPFVAPTQVIASLFGLTPTEAHVLDHIASGQTVAETAQALAIEETTVRTHMHHLFDKTGTHRQAELTQLAAALAVPVAS